METKNGNIVRTNVISGQDSAVKLKPMSKEQFESEKNFRISDYAIKKLLAEGLISAQEYKKIETIIANECGSFSCSLL